MKFLKLTILIVIILSGLAAGYLSTPAHAAASSTVVGVWYPAGLSSRANLTVGSNFQITVNATNIPDFVGYNLAFSYNTFYLDTINATTDGTWACARLPPLNTTRCDTPTIEINPGYGVIHFEQLYTDVRPGGNGTLLIINLTVTAVGRTALSLEDGNPALVASDFSPIPHTLQAGEFNNSHFSPPVVAFTFRSLNTTNQALGVIVQRDIVEFNASASYSPTAANITKYKWDFGDRSSDSTYTIPSPTHPIFSSVTTHIFAAPPPTGTGSVPISGNFTVYLQVTDANGLTNSTTALVSVEPYPNHDVAVISVTVLGGTSPTQAIVGTTLKIVVVVIDQGTFSETFPVGVYEDSTSIGQPVTVSLSTADRKRTLTFEWDTTGLEPTVYKITVRAGIVANETSTIDNQQILFVRLSLVTRSSLPLFIGGGLATLVAVGVAYSLLRRRSRAGI